MMTMRYRLTRMNPCRRRYGRCSGWRVQQSWHRFARHGSSRGHRRGGSDGQKGGRGSHGKRGGWRGLISPWPGAFLRSGRQEGGDAKWLLSTDQTALQGRLETSVCPKVFAPYFVFFLRVSSLQLSSFQTAAGA
jgi:hypothetical protein